MQAEKRAASRIVTRHSSLDSHFKADRSAGGERLECLYNEKSVQRSLCLLIQICLLLWARFLLSSVSTFKEQRHNGERKRLTACGPFCCTAPPARRPSCSSSSAFSSSLTCSVTVSADYHRLRLCWIYPRTIARPSTPGLWLRVWFLENCNLQWNHNYFCIRLIVYCIASNMSFLRTLRIVGQSCEENFTKFF